MTSKLFNLQICFETANGRMYFPVFSNLSFPYWPAESASPIPPALVWQSYRDFSRNLQLLSGLESRLGIEILEIERAEKTRTASRFETWFIVQTLIQLQETAAEAPAEI